MVSFVIAVWFHLNMANSLQDQCPKSNDGLVKPTWKLDMDQ